MDFFGWDLMSMLILVFSEGRMLFLVVFGLGFLRLKFRVENLAQSTL
jgi:hypothetical protein